MKNLVYALLAYSRFLLLATMQEQTDKEPKSLVQDENSMIREIIATEAAYLECIRVTVEVGLLVNIYFFEHYLLAKVFNMTCEYSIFRNICHCLLRRNQIK